MCDRTVNTPLNKEDFSVTARNNFMVNFQDFFFSHQDPDFTLYFNVLGCLPTFSQVMTFIPCKEKKIGAYLVIHSYLNMLSETYLLQNNIKIYFISHLTNQLITDS